MITFEISANADGNLTLPDALREALGLQVGDTLKVVQTDDHLLLIPRKLLVPEFANYMSRLLAEKGLTMDELLASGSTIRDELFAERYDELESSMN
jgi:bifunctional DNA-binding transcriptional regulator/antitoxin component of YhaV-PrlF toxin-antitoxin module